MNYLSHLALSQRTPLSYTGNLMGDFRSHLAPKALPEAILLGIENHRLVDKTTDQHPQIKHLRSLFSQKRRRYAGIILDITFDYFLIKHWQRFESSDLNVFIADCYDGLQACTDYMPTRMQRVINLMVEHDWLHAYASLEGIATSINQVSKRIRFENHLANGIEEVEENYTEIEGSFLLLFNDLKDKVDKTSIENKLR